MAGVSRACPACGRPAISRSRSRRSDSRLNSTTGSSRQSREVSLTCAALRARVVDGDQERGDALADRVPGRLGDGDHEHVALVHAGQVRGVAQADVDVAARVLVDARVRLDVGRHRDRGVVHQALADAGERHAHLDPQILQVPDRPDAGAQQVRRRMDGAAGEDHLPGPELVRTPLRVRDHADAALALEQQLATPACRSRSSGCALRGSRDRGSRWPPRRAARRRWRW